VAFSFFKGYLETDFLPQSAQRFHKGHQACRFDTLFGVGVFLAKFNNDNLLYLGFAALAKPFAPSAVKFSLSDRKLLKV